MRTIFTTVWALGFIGIAVVTTGSASFAQLSSDEKNCAAFAFASNETIDSCTRLLQSGEYSGAERAKYLIVRGDAYRQIGELDKAIEDYSEVVDAGKESAGDNYYRAYMRRAKVWEQKGSLAEAAADRFGAESARPQEDLIRLEDIVPARIRPGKLEINGQQRANEKELASGPIDPAVTSIPMAGAAGSGRRVALVIGNSAYAGMPKLLNPKRDAEAVAAALRTSGFTAVTVANDLTRERLISALRDFARSAEGSDWALVYYAGHGIEMNGTNYLIPTDARLETDRDVQYEAILLDSVLGAVEGASHLRLIVLDACRDNPFAHKMQRTGASRSIGRGLARIEPDPGTLVVYAARHGQIAADGSGKNSPFAAAFAKYITMPGIEIRKLFDLVRDEVMEATGKRQQPFTYGSLPGRKDFYFVQK